MTRSTYSATPGSCEVKWYGSLIGTYPTLASSESLERSDVVKGQRDGDWLHPTDYSASKTIMKGPRGTWEAPSGMSYKGDLYNFSTASYQQVGWQAPSYEPHLLNQAIIKARNKLLDGGFNALQDIAERQQAINLVGDRLLSIFKSVKAARDAYSAFKPGHMNPRRWKYFKSKWKESFGHLGLHNKNVARRLSENVLAWNYGVVPLHDDIKEAIHMVSNPTTLQAMIGVTGSSKEGEHGRYTRVEEKNTGYLPRTLTYTPLRSARCVLFVNPDNIALIRAAALRVNNPPLLAYELTKFSFVLDWVWPIGSWIESLGATAGWTFYSGYTMERTESWTFFSGLKDNFGTSVIEGSRYCFQFRRVRLTSFPIPGLPGFKSPFSLTHALNAVALFGARL